MSEFETTEALADGLATNVSLPKFVKMWNLRQGLDTPALHRQILRWLEKSWHEGRRELLLLVFRDAGKSTLVGLFAAWLLLRDPDLRILVLSAEQKLARKLVRNTKRIIERHPLTRGLKPPQRDQWAAEQFTVNRRAEWRDPSMLARGLGANITGSRADIVICDDVEVPANTDTAGKREELRERLAEIDYVLVPDGTQLYMGTPHSYYSIYALEPRREAGETESFLAGFERLVLPVVDEHGESRWPERFSSTRLKQIRRRSGPARFAAQMLLQPTSTVDGRLDAGRIPTYNDELVVEDLSGGVRRLKIGGTRMVSVSCWWDPAFGAPRRGDGSVIAAVFTDEAGRYYLHRIDWLTQDEGCTDADAASQLCRKAAIFARNLHVPSIRIESNGIGKFLPGLLRKALAELGCGIGVVECNNRKPKAVRILEAFDAVLADGALRVHDSVLETPFLAELREWRPSAAQQRDDGLDAVAGCLLSEPVRLGTLAERPPWRDWRSGLAPHVAPAEFDP